MKKILCWLKGHKRGISYYKGFSIWHIECSRCGYVLEYESPFIRLVGKEIQYGFTGE